MALAWKAGWVNALRGSNPLSSADAGPAVLRCRDLGALRLQGRAPRSRRAAAATAPNRTAGHRTCGRTAGPEGPPRAVPAVLRLPDERCVSVVHVITRHERGPNPLVRLRPVGRDQGRADRVRLRDLLPGQDAVPVVARGTSPGLRRDRAVHADPAVRRRH